jgi:hypothetical protein
MNLGGNSSFLREKYRYQNKKYMKNILTFKVYIYFLICVIFTSCNSNNVHDKIVYDQKIYHHSFNDEFVSSRVVAEKIEIKNEEFIDVKKFALEVARTPFVEENLKSKEEIKNGIYLQNYVAMQYSVQYYIHPEIGVVYSNSIKHGVNNEFIISEHYKYPSSFLENLVDVCRNHFKNNKETLRG